METIFNVITSNLANKMPFNPSLTGKIIFHKFSGCFV